MGSVGADYKCPWCGRVGNGGYAPDAVGYPICTLGAHSCLWYKLMDCGVTTRQEVITDALLKGVFRHKAHRGVVECIVEIVSFL